MKRGSPAQLARREPDIRSELREPVLALLLAEGTLVHGSAILPGVAHVAEPAHRFGARRLGRNAASLELGDAHLEMELEFLVDVGSDPLAAAPGQADEATKTAGVRHVRR